MQMKFKYRSLNWSIFRRTMTLMVHVSSDFSHDMDKLAFYLGIAERLDASLNSRVSKLVVEILRSKEYGRLKSIEISPANYSTPLEYMRDNLAYTYLKKSVDLPGYGPNVRRKAALLKWWEAEQACYRTNLKLSKFIGHPEVVKRQLSEPDKIVYSHIVGIRKIIESWLGTRPPAAVELGFTPGSTVSDRGWSSTIAHKIQKRPTATTQLDKGGYNHFIGTMWHHNMVDAGLSPEIVPGEELFFVDKEFTIDRIAGFQPSLNVSIQSGYGRSIKHRFYNNSGWNINRADEIHKRIACQSSRDQQFATADLTSASDMIAKVLVRLSFPPAWFKALDDCRCHYTAIDSRFIAGQFDFDSSSTPKGEERFIRVLLEKFSSMGNGFTFELETVLFAAIACYVTRYHGFPGEMGKDVFVFGDDIIVRDELYSELEQVLRYFGFIVNLKKSFTGSVPFRESCGGDYFNGVNVRGFYWKSEMDFSPEKLIRLANQIKHASERLQAIDNRLDLNGAWFYVMDHIPKGLRTVRGPAWLGDTVLYDPMPVSWTVREKRKVHFIRSKDPGKPGKAFLCTGETMITQVREILTLIPVVEYVPWHIFDPATILCCAVLRRGDGESGLVPRQTIRSYKKHWTTLEVLG